MIIDDNYLIMGSANINDRSMLGTRDSELAVFVEGPGDMHVFTGFDHMRVNRKVHEFRKRIFLEHFGVDIAYPTNPETWQQMWSIAWTNTQIYNKVFKTYPSDEYDSFAALARRDHKLDVSAFNKVYDPTTGQTMAEIDKISGHVVLFPYNFLRNEGLTENKNEELTLIAVPLFALY